GELMKACLEKEGVRCYFGTVASGDQFISDAAKKESIKKAFGAWVCEMEGGSMAQVCFVNGVRFVAVRAISDNADGEGGVDYPVFAAEAAKNSAFAVESFVGAL
ncbi:MAG: 5'-methylthioadenosine/S-adenosylhomocysteine nucleosidase, partial [Clostridia bacterium]|nr:5'-methylthioadenosine/S-adenosylhomocysteine nucleosidase [Clostridia bacterium]